MKNQILLLIISFIVSGFLFSQEENRTNRKWNDANQTTYYMGEKANSNNEWRSESYPPSDVNNPDSDAWNDALTHRSKAIWADNSSIVSDEKTGGHSYIPYSFVSEDDVLWAKRLKKLLDVRISQNHALYFPISVRYDKYYDDGAGILLNEVVNGMDARKNLYQILKDAATTINPATNEPIVSVFNPSLTRKFTKEEVLGDRAKGTAGVFQKIEVVRDRDEFGDVIDERDVVTEYESIDIIGYYIEEELFFDKRRAKLDFRYISITPLVVSSTGNGLYSGSDRTVKELGTFYFPEIRHLLANHKIFPLNGNIAQRISFDEFFHRKLFASNVIKETNIYDRYISDYLPGRSLEQLLEGERIREHMRRYESDMWNY